MRKTFENIFIVGDVHGRWNDLADLISKTLPSDSLIIQVGDFGLGFPGLNLKAAKNTLQPVLTENNSELYIIRGNHDDPDYWQKTKKVGDITLLKDYMSRTINGKRFLFVGGGISIDRSERIVNVSYWFDEAVHEKNLNTLKKCDVLVSHSAPENFYPIGCNEVVMDFSRYDSCLLEHIKRERHYLRNLVEKVKPEKVYYGHFHLDWVEKINNMDVFALGELQVRQLKGN